MPTPPTSTPWVPIFDTRAKIQVPTPVNGKWARAVSGAVAWQDIPGFQAPDAGWQIIGPGGAIPYQNGWTDWPDATYTPCRFRKLSDGLVILEGLIGNAGTDSAAAFTLPVGYRPSLSQTGTVQIFHRFTGGSYLPTWGNFWVYADGQVIPSISGVNHWISLNNIKFYAGG